MKKIFALIIHIITFTPCIFTMNTESINEKALICASKNINISFGQPDADNACHMIRNLSFINKNLYNQTNNPPTTRTIINHLANKYRKTETEIACLLNISGAKKCIELNDELINCISKEFYLPSTMHELIGKGANPNIALFYVWRQIRTPKIPDITDIPITKIMSNTSQILDFNNNLKKQFKFLCRQQAFDKKTLTEILSLKKMINSMKTTLQVFELLSLSTSDHTTIEETTILKGFVIESFLQSLASRLEKNQPFNSMEQDRS